MVIRAAASWLEAISHNGKTDHDAKMDKLAYPLIEGVDAESYIIQNYLKPGEPEDGEEAHVWREGYDCKW